MEAALPVLTIAEQKTFVSVRSVVCYCCMPVTLPYNIVVYHLPVTLSGIALLYTSDFVRFNTAVFQ